MKKKNKKFKPFRRGRSYRCTDEEYAKLIKYADETNMSVGRYLVECGLKNAPKKRLTQEEVEALNSLTAARTDLINVRNALSGKSEEEKSRLFNSRTFMKWWVNAVTKLIKHWYDIEDRLTSNVHTKEKEES